MAPFLVFVQQHTIGKSCPIGFSLVNHNNTTFVRNPSNDL